MRWKAEILSFMSGCRPPFSYQKSSGSESEFTIIFGHAPAHLRAVQHVERPFLHAARLAFTHPSDGRAIKFSCALPADLQEVLDTLRAVTAERAAKQ